MRKKPKAKRALPPAIYPEYYGADAYRSNVFPQDIQANPGTELLSQEIIHEICIQEAKKLHISDYLRDEGTHVCGSKE